MLSSQLDQLSSQYTPLCQPRSTCPFCPTHISHSYCMPACPPCRHLTATISYPKQPTRSYRCCPAYCLCCREQESPLSSLRPFRPPRLDVWTRTRGSFPQLEASLRMPGASYSPLSLLSAFDVLSFSSRLLFYSYPLLGPLEPCSPTTSDPSRSQPLRQSRRQTTKTRLQYEIRLLPGPRRRHGMKRKRL
jgi:hypothetical protein